MNRLIIALTLISASVNTHAETWFQISGSTDKEYSVEFDIDSVTLKRYVEAKPELGMFVSGVARHIAHGKEITKFANAVDLEECLTQTSGSIKSEFMDGHSSIETWYKSGASAADNRGKFLCGFVTGSIKAMPKQKPQPKKIWI